MQRTTFTVVFTSPHLNLFTSFAHRPSLVKPHLPDVRLFHSVTSPGTEKHLCTDNSASTVNDIQRLS